MSRNRALQAAVLLATGLIPSGVAAQSAPATPSLSPASFVWAAHGDPNDPMSKGSPSPPTPGGTGAVTLAPDGRIWVADTGNSRFAIFDPDGTFVEYWGTEGKGPGEFVLHRSNGDGFTGIGFAPDGTFYVLDTGNRRVEHFGADRHYLGEWGGFGSEPGRFADPIGLAVDVDDTILVVDDTRNVVERFAPDGTVLQTFQPISPDDFTVGGVTVDGAGNVYVAAFGQGSTIRRYDASGTLTQTFGGDGPEGMLAPTGPIAIDAAGHVFVAAVPDDRDRILVFQPDASLLTRFGGGGPAFGTGPEEELTFPFGMALDDAGALYVTEFMDGSVKRFDLSPALAPGASTRGDEAPGQSPS